VSVLTTTDGRRTTRDGPKTVTEGPSPRNQITPRRHMTLRRASLCHQLLYDIRQGQLLTTPSARRSGTPRLTHDVRAWHQQQQGNAWRTSPSPRSIRSAGPAPRSGRRMTTPEFLFLFPLILLFSLFHPFTTLLSRQYPAIPLKTIKGEAGSLGGGTTKQHIYPQPT
jgi:hypothetical protein